MFNFQPFLPCCFKGLGARPQEKGVCRGSPKAAEARGKAFPPGKVESEKVF